jgi:hypothetical protein
VLSLKKANLLSLALAALLLVSFGVNLYYASQNSALIDQGNVAEAKVEMVATLHEVQASIEAEIKRIGDSLIYASKQLSTTGLTGPQAHAILAALAANSSYIINAATVNLQDTIVAAEPQEWSYIEGRNVGEQIYLNPNPHGEIRPVMSPVIPLQSDMMGNLLTAPIFNSNRELIGTVSVIFEPSQLVNGTTAATLAGTPYTMSAMQIDGLMVYDTDLNQIYKNMFTDPVYQDYTQLIQLGRHIAEFRAGYGKYEFTENAASNLVVIKELYWTTVSAYGEEWRVSVQRVIN